MLHNGLHDNTFFGNIPIILLVGDDYQLLPVGIGAAGKFSGNLLKESTAMMGYVNHGHKVFKTLGGNYIELKTSKRILKGQQLLKKCLEGVRGDTDRGLGKSEIQHLMKFHLNATH